MPASDTLKNLPLIREGSFFMEIFNWQEAHFSDALSRSRKMDGIALASGFVMGLSCPVTLKIKGFSAIVNKET